MTRLATRIVTLALLTVVGHPVAAQQWARDMAEVKDHDFGVVARGSDTVFKFPIKNLYQEDVVLSSVRSSCGCTSASLENSVIKTHQTGYVVAKFNTRTFTGHHSATLTVQISKPYPAQLQLRVKGNIRGDVVFEPGSIDFGQVDQGSAQTRTVSVRYAGRSGWSLTDVRSASDYLVADFTERERSGYGRVIYDLSVRMTDSAPAGYLKTQLVLVTSDRSNPRIPLGVAADIRPELTVAPSTLVLGDVVDGQGVTKRLLVRGKRPFKITDATCADPRFVCEFSDTPATKQIVTLRFSAGGSPGRLKAPITFKTDLGDTFTTVCTAYANVQPAPAVANGG